MSTERVKILLTGASGYVGGRLLKRLEGQGHDLRCLARRPEFLAPRVASGTEIVEGDVLSEETLVNALQGVDVAYYLVHSMGSEGDSDFEDQDRVAAGNFARAARTAGVERIIYLGGLGVEGSELSKHLRSRHEVGQTLRSTGVETVEFRASAVIGSGSISFEMLTSLVDRLPVMVTPRWVRIQAQPIAIDDLIDYLEAAIELELAMDESDTESRFVIYEIGGQDRISYGDLMREYARQRGLKRAMIPVPLLTPRLSSLWLGLVTPLYARVGRALIDSICHETIVTDDRASHDFDIEPMSVKQAIARAFETEESGFVETRWSDAISSGGTDPAIFGGYGGVRIGRRLGDVRQKWVGVDPARAFVPIKRIGGRTGWYGFNWLWRLRGFIDLLVGGVGMRRGRPDADVLRVGDPLDFWRVERFEPGRLLRLEAEMKVPGRAWLEFEIVPEDGGCVIRQTATFDPSGVAGLAYWYAIYPLHVAVFRRMLNGIARAAENAQDD